MNALDVYGNKLRVRACGICANETGILLINHGGLHGGDFWSPPGGGIEFGETAEFIKQPLHAIELFFEIDSYVGNPSLGIDPELENADQFIKSLKFMRWEEFTSCTSGSLHGIFNFLDIPSEIKNLTGYFKV
jgi:8-oxo-dGTP diphosphatase